jgi:hypothetical protein
MQRTESSIDIEKIVCDWRSLFQQINTYDIAADKNQNVRSLVTQTTRQ